jgi:transposase
MMRKTYRYRLYPNKQQAILLEWTLARCQELYNAALQERRDAWRVSRESVNYFAQAAQLVEIKKRDPNIKRFTVKSCRTYCSVRIKRIKHFSLASSAKRKPDSPVSNPPRATTALIILRKDFQFLVLI